MACKLPVDVQTLLNMETVKIHACNLHTFKNSMTAWPVSGYTSLSYIDNYVRT